jgi:hypothetical protein
MKSLLAAALAMTAVLAAVPALADPTAPASLPSPANIQVPEHTFVIHLEKPNVVVDIKTPTAASAAGAAHEAFRARMMRQYEPVTLRPAQ